MTLSGQQMLDVGDYPSGESDHSQSQTSRLGLQYTTAPHGYYNQEGRAAQLALPGMEMTPQEHAKALGDFVASKFPEGWRAEPSVETEPLFADESRRKHYLNVAMFDDEGRFVGNNDLDWNGDTGNLHVDTPGVHGHQPGEITYIHTDFPGQGIAKEMVRTAYKIASEYPEQFSSPRNSTVKTRQGTGFSQAVLSQHGMDTW